MSGARKIIAAIVIVVAVAGAFLGFTKPGHQVLFNLGFTSACDNGCS
jgi:hypothetical protein